MAIGFPASYSVKFAFAAARGQAREAVRYAFSVLGWQFEEQGPDRFRARITMSGSSWGETFSVSFGEGEIEIRSVCRYPLQLFDWGKNRQNVDHFLTHFSAKETRDASTAGAFDQQLTDEDGGTPVTRLFANDQGDGEE